MVERIRSLCGTRYITLNKLEKELGLSKSSVVKWDDHPPSIDKVIKVANFFDVSLDYVVGRSDDPQRKK